MKAHLETDAIKEHWTSQALKHGGSHRASWSDVHAVEMEKRLIADYLPRGGRMLDIGCSNGHATLDYARFQAMDVVGVDYVPEMVEAARRNLAAASGGLAASVRFEQGDVRSLAFPDGAFDLALTTRVIINLHDRETQLQGVRECLRVVRPGGVALLSEATTQGLDRINALRAELGMTPLPMPGFNLYLDVEELRAWDLGCETRMEVIDFSSTYYLLTRVFKPILAQLPGSLVRAADPESEVNRLAGALPSWGDYGVQKLIVIRKGA